MVFGCFASAADRFLVWRCVLHGQKVALESFLALRFWQVWARF